VKCPLLVQMSYIKSLPRYEMATACLKEECALWFKDNESCSIATIAQGTVYLHKVMLEVAEKMPTWRQFAKCDGGLSR